MEADTLSKIFLALAGLLSAVNFAQIKRTHGQNKGESEDRLLRRLDQQEKQLDTLQTRLDGAYTDQFALVRRCAMLEGGQAVHDSQLAHQIDRTQYFMLALAVTQGDLEQAMSERDLLKFEVLELRRHNAALQSQVDRLMPTSHIRLEDVFPAHEGDRTS